MTAPPAPAQAPERKPPSDEPLKGIVMMVGAMLLVPTLDGLAKHLSADYGTLQLVWARYFFHAAALLPFVLWRYGRRALAPQRPVLQILRGGLLLASTVLFFAAIARMPLADAVALVFVYPMAVTLLSALVLGEAVGPRRWSAVVVGFIGALIVIRPGLGVIGQGGLLALGAGGAYALYVLTTRQLAGSAPPLVTLTFTALLGCLVTTLAVPFAWRTPDALDLALMVAMGLIAAAVHFLIIRALEHASASLLAPYGYSEIVMATAIGFFVFGDFPDAWTWLGIAVIVASGLYISLRERVLRLARRTAAQSTSR